MKRLAIALLLSACHGSVEPSRETGGSTLDAGAADGPTHTLEMDASGVPIGAVVLQAPLPACTWPAAADPPVPSSDTSTTGVSRAFLICGTCVDSTGPGDCQYGPSDGTTLSWSPCISACEADEYAFLTLGQNGPASPDAHFVEGTAPAGCHDPNDAFSVVLSHDPSSGGTPGVSCCPCVPPDAEDASPPDAPPSP